MFPAPQYSYTWSCHCLEYSSNPLQSHNSLSFRSWEPRVTFLPSSKALLHVLWMRRSPPSEKLPPWKFYTYLCDYLTHIYLPHGHCKFHENRAWVYCHRALNPQPNARHTVGANMFGETGVNKTFKTMEWKSAKTGRKVTKVKADATVLQEKVKT